MGRGLPKKYAKMGFVKGWAAYKKTDAYKNKKKRAATKPKAKPRKKPVGRPKAKPKAKPRKKPVGRPKAKPKAKPRKKTSTPRSTGGRKIDYAEKKWLRKTLSGLKHAAKQVKKPESYTAYCNSISAVTGIPVSKVRASIPAQEWKKWSQHPEESYRLAEKMVREAGRTHKWKKNYKKAFGG